MWELWNWFDANGPIIAAYMLGTMFVSVLGLMVYHSNWRDGYAWARTRFYPWLRETWGKYAYPIRFIRKWKRSHEKRVAERKALDRFWMDIIVQAGESAVHAGEFSREQVNQSYVMFGTKAGLSAILPKHLESTRRDIRGLKDSILKRIGPEARQAFKEKKEGKDDKRSTAKMIRARFRRAFRNAA